jgi:hypothetical protein
MRGEVVTHILAGTEGEIVCRSDDVDAMWKGAVPANALLESGRSCSSAIHLRNCRYFMGEQSRANPMKNIISLLVQRHWRTLNYGFNLPAARALLFAEIQKRNTMLWSIFYAGKSHLVCIEALAIEDGQRLQNLHLTSSFNKRKSLKWEKAYKREVFCTF